MMSVEYPAKAKSKTLRFGSRAIVAAKDTDVRSYPVNRLIEFHAGVKRGHVEIILLRRWRVLLQSAS